MVCEKYQNKECFGGMWEDVMWKKEYYNNNGELHRDLSREDDGTPIEKIGKYEIIFDFEEQRYFCFVDAINVDEALGIFFISHDTVSFQNIVDCMEI